MTFVIVFLLIITAICLYEFFDSRDVKNITAIAAKSKDTNRNNQDIQKYSTVILSSILGILVVVILLTTTIYDNMTFVSHVIEQTNPQKSDTLEIIFNLPPPEDDKKQEQIQEFLKQRSEVDINNDVAQDNAQKSDSRTNIASENNKENSTKGDGKKYNSVEEEVRDFERRLFAEAAGNSERAEIERGREETRQKREKFEKEQQDKKQSSGTKESSVASKKGKTMVSYYLPNRLPHNNNKDNIKNPGYTCEQGSYGEVVIKIKVNGMGQVTSATPASSYAGLNPCLVEQALKYAKLSRFNADDLANQEGTITYIFMP